MTAQLYIKRGGAGATETEVTSMTGRKGAPFFDGQTPLISLGMRFVDGEASQGAFLLNDPDAEIFDSDPSTSYRLVPHALVTWTEDASGDELWLARNRIAPVESGRRSTYIANRDVEWNVGTVDCNIDLTGNHFINPWERPAETDIARIIALQAYVLNGSSSTISKKRQSTVITASTSHLLNDNTTYNMPAKTYPPGTIAKDVLQDIAERAGKSYGVVIHHTGGTSHLCLLYIQENDHATYKTDVKISQNPANWDPDDPTAPVVEPKWDRGKGTRTDNNGVISGLVSIYGGTNEEPDSIFVDQPGDEFPYEFWTDSFFDDKSETVTEATNRANAILEARRGPGHRTHQLSIKLHADQTQLICAGMSIEVKSVVVSPTNPLTYVNRRITELKWEPSPDGDYWAHIDLDKPLRNAAIRGGAIQPAATHNDDPNPEPPPVCEPPEEASLPDDDLSADWRTGDPTRVDPLVGGPADYPWGHVGQLTHIGGIGTDGVDVNHTRVDGSEPSQNFTVTAGTTLWVSTALAKTGGPITATATVKFKNGAGTILSTVNQTYDSGEAHSIPGSYYLRWVYPTFEYTVPTGAVYADFRVSNLSAVLYLFAGTPAAPAEECPPFSVDPGGFPNDPDGDATAGTSPYYLPSNSPLLDATDQHVTTRLSNEMVNASGGDLVAGTVVVPINQGEFDTTTTASYADGMVGILLEDTEEDAVGIVKWEGVGGLVPTFTGSVTTGDYIYTSTTAGSATTSATRDEGAVGRVILATSGTANYIEWWGVPDSSSGTSVSTVVEAGRAFHGRFVAAYHRASDGFPLTMFSDDGITWTDGPVIHSGSGRDPSIIHWDAQYWSLQTAGPTDFTHKVSDDLETWTLLSNIVVDAAATQVWAGEWIRNMDGTPWLHPSTGLPAILIAVSTDNETTWTFREIHPTDRAMTSWSSPVTLTGSGLPTKWIDPFLLVDGDDYWLWYKNEGANKRIELATSSTALTSGYTVLESGDWAGWYAARDSGANSIEGPCVIRLNDGRWRIYFNENNGLSSIRTVYSETTDDWRTGTSTWTTQAEITTDAQMGHGSVIYIPGVYDHERDPEAHPDLQAAVVTDHGALTGLGDDDHTQYIKDSEFAAKGDVLAGTAAGTFDNVGVGSNGQVLTADSTATTGVSWQAASGVGIGEILVADTHSTPLVFGDLLQNEAEDNLLYADPT